MARPALALAFLPLCVLSVRNKRTRANVVMLPSNPNLTPVGVVMNPGGTVEPGMYEKPMRRWQEEAEKQGMSLWITVLEYLFNLPLEFEFKSKFTSAVAQMKSDGMPSNATIVFTGHSMGGGASQNQQMELYAEGAFKGVILQASSIVRTFFPPMAESFGYTAPTLSIGAELNFGFARITRFAEGYYRQSSMRNTHPVVMIEGMNHMQFTDGFEKDDLKPEISTEAAWTAAALLSVDWIAYLVGKPGAGELVAQEAVRAGSLLKPVIDAFEYEGSRSFNAPYQVDTPGWDSNNWCPRGVCAESSEFVNDAQAYLIGEELMYLRSGGFKLSNNFADLLPFRLGEREERKPFIVAGDVPQVQAYVMAPVNEGDYKGDTQLPVANAQLNVKMISRQYAGKSIGVDLADDSDFCKDINTKVYEDALAKASPKTRERFLKFGQPLNFVDTAYQGAGPLWYYSNLEFKDQGDRVDVKSTGLFTPPGDRAIDGNHYCKLLSPARATEWIYVDGLEKNLIGIW